MKILGRIDRVTGLIILHPFVVAFILLTSYPPLYRTITPSWYLVLASCVLTVVFLAVRRRIPQTVLLYMVFISDVPLAGAIIQATGGIESLFPLIYVILILAASIYLYRRGAYIVAICATVLLFGLVFHASRGLEGYALSVVMYRFYIFGLLFLLVGILSGGLSESYQRRVEEAARLRLTTEDIIRNLPSGVITVDSAGAILYTNMEEGRLRSTVHLQVAKFMNSGGASDSFELKLNDRHYMLRCVHIFGGKAGLAIIQDVTDLRKLEESARVASETRLLAELGGSLAHEIRNPLSSIMGSLEVIRDDKVRKQARPFVEMALKETKRLNDIVTDFLNFSQFTPKNLNKARISEVINEALVSSLFRENVKGLVIKRRAGDFSIRCDMDKLKSGFTNVLNNAYEVSPAGSTVEIRSYRRMTKGCVEIRDEGPGIEEKNLKRVFEPFYTTKKGGTGLGLAIAQNIIKAHHGGINARSKPGQGTTFVITLPLA